jgi:hypothetical protein
VDDLAFVLREVLRIADHAVVETRTDGQQHVAVLHRVVGFDGAVHAQHAEELAVAGRVGAQPHQRIGDRVAEQVDQRAQLVRGIAEQHAAAGIDVGSLGVQQQLQRLADLAAVALAHRVVRAHLDLVGVAVVADLLEGHVLRHIHHHRARPAAARNVKCFFHRHGQILGILDEEVVLDDRPRDADGVAFLECVEPDRRRRHLARNDHHRDAVHVSGRNTGDRIGQSRPRSHQRDADIAGRPGVAVGGMHSGLLVAHQHVLDGVLLVERVVNVENRAAGIAPDVLHAFGLQCLDQHFGTHEFLRLTAGDGCCGSEFRLRDFHDEPLRFFGNEKPWVLLRQLL